MAEKSDNLFDRLDANERKIEEITRAFLGDAAWSQPGLLTILKSIQTDLQRLESRLTLLSWALVVLMVLCLILLVTLVLHLRLGV